MVTSTAAVLRAGMDRLQELPIQILVPGDIVYLPRATWFRRMSGLSDKDLFVSQPC
jgi:hypothetical protein